MTTPNNDDKKFILKVLIDREKNKVLFAEADSDFVDVLLSFMTLPLGTIIRLVDEHLGPQEEAIGSLNTLYGGLKNLSHKHFWSEKAKMMLLCPRNFEEIECRKLKINLDDKYTKYYICEDLKCNKYLCVTVSTFNDTKCSCGKLMNREIEFDTSDAQAGQGVFTVGKTSFIIRDDLEIIPNIVPSTLLLLRPLLIKHLSAVEQRSFDMGLKEVISLLKSAMVSNTPLSDVFLHTKPPKLRTFCSDLSQRSSDTLSSMKMVVRVMVQKSTKKVLLAQAEEDFIDLLFSMLAIPPGRLVTLVTVGTSRSMYNLYKTITNLKLGETEFYLKEGVWQMLMRSDLSPQYCNENRIFSIGERTSELSYKRTSELSYKRISESGKYNISLMRKTPTSFGKTDIGPVFIKDPEFKGAFVRGPAVYMITDDLVVTPCSSISIMYFLDRSGISLSDINHIELSIGKLEALKILNASLHTSSALTNGLHRNLKSHFR